MKVEGKTFQERLLPVIKQLEVVLSDPSNHDHNVTRYLSGKEMEQHLSLGLEDEGCDEESLLSYLKEYLRYTPKTTSADFNKLLFSGFNEVGVLGDWVAAATNTTMHTYQVAPVATLMEKEVINKLNEVVGFENGDGIMVSGGTNANMVGMMLGRHRACSDIKENGYPEQKLVAFVSDQAHYSFEKGANTLGIGCRNLVAIETDERGRMLPAALETQIQESLKQGHLPFFIGLTLGTTVTGAFDPIQPCAEIAKKYGLWLHLDGAWGGPALLSDQTKELAAHSQLADSFTWDAHKFMNVPLTAAAILVNHSEDLKACCSGGGGEYLFHPDENVDYNIGSKSLQCGRRVDSLKFWLSWRAAGTNGYAKKIDDLLSVKEHILHSIDENPQLQLLAPASFLNILFRYQPEGVFDSDKLRDLNVELCKRLMREDLTFVDYATFKGEYGIRLILANDEITNESMTYFLEQVSRIGGELYTD